jgi:hypothetical protein
MNQFANRTLAVLVSAAALASSVLAVPLPPGSNNVPLPGTTAAADPTLVGPVLADELRTFEIFGGGGALLFRGELQLRVQRSNITNTLIFSWKVVNSQPGLNGIVARIEAESFKDFLVRADWRSDSPGAAMPNFGDRNGSGSVINYDFLTPPLFSGADSRFFFAFTDAQDYNADGCVTIYLTTGEFVTLPAFAPGAPCDSCRGDVNGDGVVNFADLNEVLAAFGTTCPPPMLP